MFAQNSCNDRQNKRNRWLHIEMRTVICRNCTECTQHISNQNKVTSWSNSWMSNSISNWWTPQKRKVITKKRIIRKPNYKCLIYFWWKNNVHWFALCGHASRVNVQTIRYWKFDLLSKIHMIHITQNYTNYIRCAMLLELAFYLKNNFVILLRTLHYHRTKSFRMAGLVHRIDGMKVIFR